MSMNSNSKRLAVLGMFTAIIFLLAFTPFGYIQLPFIKATVIHIPVIIGAVILGPKYGAVLGFMFGATSFINNTISPVLSSFVFSPLIPQPTTGQGSPFALAVCFIPRILVGVIPWFVYAGLKKIIKTDTVCLAAAGVSGALTNTLLVMHMIYLLFKDSYAAIQNMAADGVYTFILGIIAANGIPEAVVAGVLTTAICLPLKRLIKHSL